MKETRSLLNGLFACSVALAMISTVNAQMPNQGNATVLRIKGSARYTTGNNVWEPLKVGAQLPPGSVIQTGLDKGSFVDLALNNSGKPAPVRGGTMGGGSGAHQPMAQQDVVRVGEDSLLGIDRLTSLETGADVINETQLDLKKGRVTGKVKKMSAASKYEVKIPNGVVGVRGTTYNITADGVIQVTAGSVVVAWVGSDGSTKTQVVMAGEQFDIRTGQITRIAADVAKIVDKTVDAIGGAFAAPITYTADRNIVYLEPTVSPTDGSEISSE
jgi:uncharacterized protein YaiE (UPF0345 family)